MNIPYILITVVVLAIVCLVVIWRTKKAGKRLEYPTLLPISTILIVGAIAISDKVLSYNLIALAVILALVDGFRIFKKLSKS